MESYWAVTTGIIASALFSGLAAFFGTWLNRNRYYREKWWDRKSEAYATINKYFRIFAEINLYIRRNKVRPNHGELNELQARADKISKDFYLELAEHSVYLSSEALLEAYKISDLVSGLVVEIFLISTEHSRYSNEESTESILSIHIEQFTVAMREDLRVNESTHFWKSPYFRRSQN